MISHRVGSLILLMLLGCAPANVSPGMTFLAGLNHYQVEMARLESRPDRWFDRQRLGESLKQTHLVTMGGSREFNRLIDLDVRRREFVIALRDPSLRPDRAKEIRAELPAMQRNMDDLKGVIKRQLSAAELRAHEQPQVIETVAAIGLLHLGLDGFSGSNSFAYPSVRAVKVGQYLVTDHGNVTTVRTPEGQTYRCALILVQDEGAGIRCEPPSGK
ncbi:MAG: hypothetical protein ACREX3_11785 [Gammaproteobacteria bacterium]